MTATTVTVKSSTPSEAVPMTPLPWRQLGILSLVSITEPIHFTLVFPFIYFMVRDLHVSDDIRYIGFYVGILAAAFSVAQLATSMVWGILSDRIGRRPVLLIGVAGSIVCPILFGMSQTFAWAVVMRLAWGMLNGNTSTIKTMVGELTDESNQAKGFATLPLCWNIGCVIGPVLGGLLSNPVQNLPWLFGSSVLFKTFPYLLPCMCCSALSFLAWVFNYLYLEETMDDHPFRDDDGNATEEEEVGIVEYQEVMEEGHLIPEADGYPFYGSVHHSTISGGGDHISCTVSSHSADTVPDETSTLLAHTSTMIQLSAGTMVDITTLHDPLSLSGATTPTNTVIRTDLPSKTYGAYRHSSKESAPSASVGLSIALTGDRLRCTIGYALVALLTVMIDEMFPIWAATQPRLGGMGMSSRAIGGALSTAGFLVIYLQIYLYPKAQLIWGTLRCFQYGVALCAVVFPCFAVLHRLEFIDPVVAPIVHLLGNDGLKVFTWVVMLGLLTLKEWCGVLYYTSICILINNSVPDRRYLGTVNSVSYSAASFARTIGPAISGMLWTWSLTSGYPFPFNYNCIFVATGTLALITYLLSLTWDARLDRRAFSKSA
ncbi:hypothetical protein IWQ60_007374 [Tieghemiomyces parasiticus]|uniref:Major facilitator superfamily (MFS) profile domain-containing protein n=1 Tax=Tieghemiomyces parasiticus TaxID=78921 RepID=A0A9W8A5W9_9FUNG|nr:hypothetical protein IWQ60_007374 [Tieghemiomyces parasiticus]